MPDFFVISDTHFSHAAMLKFEEKDGTRTRHEFQTVEEMDEAMVERWNKVVRPQDHVYHLGDVAMKKEFLPIVRRLNGHKRLIMGNHDIFEVKYYLNAGFEKIMAYRVLDGLIMSHVPIHSGCLGRFKLNVHGHLHRSIVNFYGTENDQDPRYLCVCVEQINYTPISLEEIKQKTNHG